MHPEIFNKKTLAAFKHLAASRVLNGFYLGGGTGLAFHLGHRLSYDLDFFSRREFSVRMIIAKLQKAGAFTLDSQDEGTVHGQFAEIKLSFLHYPYPLLYKTKHYLGVMVADPRDIGCMKLDAISSRGTKKDFIDLFFLFQTISLKDILSIFEKKYRQVEYNLAHVLKSLVYFEDARQDAEPIMLRPYSWKEVERAMEREVKKLL